MTGNYTILAFNVSSSLSICNVSDIIYKITATGSVQGSTNSFTFDPVKMLILWNFSTKPTLGEIFAVNLTATITT